MVNFDIFSYVSILALIIGQYPVFSCLIYNSIFTVYRIIKKVWVYKRTGVKGWWCGWYGSGIRKAKALPSKKLSEHFKHIKYTQLNSDVFTGQVLADWSQMIGEYREAKKSRESPKEHFMKLHCHYEISKSA